ncbi:FIST signal transduction protein [Sandaracinus amylolyticus]|uniref:FIST signal transduction protein n=1 Tax=Sandaracinus amylolyticus TaxID=927083 RepID=UPI001F3A4C5F|nr:FIST N-terminal domain-containing protein [Sandaracinus amylolyticus]
MRARWALVYATSDAASVAMVASARSRADIVLGCTSSGGVFTPRGFERGAFALIGEDGDPDLQIVGRACGAAPARRAARDAAQQLAKRLGRKPDALLLHATPGFEERIIEGIDDAFEGAAPPTYGGSAADDDLSGQWRAFHGATVEREGFVLGAFTSASPIHGSFVSGYVPGRQRGVVTRAAGRVVYEIDRRPAAEVYDEWRGGELGREPGVVLAKTTLHPLGRVIDRVGNLPRHLLSHPHEVRSDGSLSLFTEVATGDELVMMIGSRGSLMDRTEQAVSRALGSERGRALRGGVLVYCGGCVMAIGDAARDVGTLYSRAIGGAPFVGAATFGEIGCFTGPTPTNRHGNLMCDTLLFA